MKPDFTQFVSIFTDEVVGVFDYFSPLPDDVDMVSGCLPGLECC
jgi:hypothetical protein